MRSTLKFKLYQGAMILRMMTFVAKIGSHMEIDYDEHIENNGDRPENLTYGDEIAQFIMDKPEDLKLCKLGPAWFAWKDDHVSVRIDLDYDHPASKRFVEALMNVGLKPELSLADGSYEVLPHIKLEGSTFAYYKENESLLSLD